MLIFVVESYGVVLAEGCLFLCAFGVGSDFSFGEGLGKVIIELEGCLIFVGDSGSGRRYSGMCNF